MMNLMTSATAALLLGAALAALPSTAAARNIVIANDDGLTANVKALYDALKAQGHDVIVSVPCTNQSGMGAALKVMQPIPPLAKDCRNGAAKAGERGAGPVTGAGFERDFFYVDGTPVAALLYGLDIEAARRWGRPAELVLSGPNEGQNVGQIVLTSGTVSVAQYAASRGIPAIALSAGKPTTGGPDLDNAESRKVAALAVELVTKLERASLQGPLLPPRTALNVNFPDRLDGAAWELTQIGTYNVYKVGFSQEAAGTAHPGVAVEANAEPPSPGQAHDEAAQYQRAITVSPMQAGYDLRNPRSSFFQRLRKLLKK